MYQDRGRVPLDPASLPGKDFNKFLADFVTGHSAVRQDPNNQRIWFFEKPRKAVDGNLDGYIKYGVYGFESDLIDSTTKKHRYKRKVGDYEQIELYFQLWRPASARGALLALQSFQGRSCISYVNQALIEDFRKSYPGFTMKVRKLMPDNLKGSVFARSPVKAISLVTRHAHADLRRNYGTAEVPEELEVTVRLSARKKGSFGPFGSLDEAAMKKLRMPVWLIGADNFEKATAEIDWRGKRRKVGVFGYNNEAGSVIVTEEVAFGPNGHPTFDSLRDQTDDLLGSFADALGYVGR